MDGSGGARLTSRPQALAQARRITLSASSRTGRIANPLSINTLSSPQGDIFPRPQSDGLPFSLRGELGEAFPGLFENRRLASVGIGRSQWGKAPSSCCFLVGRLYLHSAQSETPDVLSGGASFPVEFVEIIWQAKTTA
jgi:hypothetical protein